jgi:hypothetical protein
VCTAVVLIPFCLYQYWFHSVVVQFHNLVNLANKFLLLFGTYIEVR